MSEQLPPGVTLENWLLMLNRMMACGYSPDDATRLRQILCVADRPLSMSDDSFYREVMDRCIGSQLPAETITKFCGVMVAVGCTGLEILKAKAILSKHEMNVTDADRAFLESVILLEKQPQQVIQPQTSKTAWQKLGEGDDGLWQIRLVVVLILLFFLIAAIALGNAPRNAKSGVNNQRPGNSSNTK